MTHPDADRKTDLRELLHSLNQPLTAIGNYAQAGAALVAAGRADNAALLALLDKITQQARRASDISRELAAAAKAGGSNPA
jgi:two-component system sensor kinase FixL